MQMACEVVGQLQSTEVFFPLTTYPLSHISDAVTGLEDRVPSRSSLCSSLFQARPGKGVNR